MNSLRVCIITKKINKKTAFIDKKKFIFFESYKAIRNIAPDFVNSILKLKIS